MYMRGGISLFTAFTTNCGWWKWLLHQLISLLYFPSWPCPYDTLIVNSKVSTVESGYRRTSLLSAYSLLDACRLPAKICTVQTLTNRHSVVGGTIAERGRVRTSSNWALTFTDDTRNESNTEETCETGLYLTASPSIVQFFARTFNSRFHLRLNIACLRVGFHSSRGIDLFDPRSLSPFITTSNVCFYNYVYTPPRVLHFSAWLVN